MELLSNLITPAEKDLEAVSTASVRRNRRLRPDEVDRLTEAYQIGVGALELSKEFGISRSALYSHLKRREISVKRSPGVLSRFGVRRAVELYRSGLSLAAVGEELGVGPGVIRRELIKAGVARRPRGRSY